MIYRGTTPTIRFRLDIDVTKVVDLKILFSQGGNILFTKYYNDCEIYSESNSVFISLTRDETLELEANKDLHMQLILDFNDGRVSASRYLTEYVHDIMSEEY